MKQVKDQEVLYSMINSTLDPLRKTQLPLGNKFNPMNPYPGRRFPTGRPPAIAPGGPVLGGTAGVTKQAKLKRYLLNKASSYLKAGLIGGGIGGLGGIGTAYGTVSPYETQGDTLKRALKYGLIGAGVGAGIGMGGVAASRYNTEKALQKVTGKAGYERAMRTGKEAEKAITRAEKAKTKMRSK